MNEWAFIEHNNIQRSHTIIMILIIWHVIYSYESFYSLKWMKRQIFNEWINVEALMIDTVIWNEHGAKLIRRHRHLKYNHV